MTKQRATMTQTTAALAAAMLFLPAFATDDVIFRNDCREALYVKYQVVEKTADGKARYSGTRSVILSPRSNDVVVARGVGDDWLRFSVYEVDSQGANAKVPGRPFRIDDDGDQVTPSNLGDEWATYWDRFADIDLDFSCTAGSSSGDQVALRDTKPAFGGGTDWLCDDRGKFGVSCVRP